MPWSVLTVLLLTNLLVFYRPTLLHPNSTQLNSSGDAFKNYYTPTYHVKYDENYWWFEGMNYPYGEHVVFSDAQPLISNTLKFISHNIVDISGSTQGILNLLMILSFFPGAIFLFLLFRKLKVPPLPAAIFSGLIMLLSPQILRFPGHYALAYLCYVPMLLWGVWTAWENRENPIPWKRWAWSGGVGLFILMWGFIQPYYIMLGGLLAAAVWVMTALYTWRIPMQEGFGPDGKKSILARINWKKLMLAGLHLILQGMLPLVFFKLFLSATDPVTDRPEVPFGFFEYHAYWESVFLPIDFPHLKPLDSLSKLLTGGGIRPISWEGKAYVGLPAAMVFAFFFFRLLFQSGRGVIKKDWKYVFRPSPNRQLNIFIYASCLILLFSCTFPFVWKFKAVVQYIPYLNQFRSIGRFAWLFYYIWTVFTCYFLWLNFRKWRIKGSWKKPMGYAVLGLAMAVFAFEGYYWNHHIARNRLTQSPNPPIESVEDHVPELSWIKEINPDDHAALMMLPYFHEGSENINHKALKVVAPAFQASLRTGLPLTNVMMSRTSLSQTLAQTELQKEEYRPLRALEAWESNKSLLVVRLKEVPIIAIDDLHWFAEKVYEDEFTWAKSLTREHLDTLGTGTNWKIQVALNTIRDADTLIPLGDGKFQTAVDPSLHWDPMDGEEGEKIYRGAGAGQQQATQNKYLWRGPIPGVKAGDILTFSAWLYVGEEGHPKHFFGLEMHPRGDFGEPRYWNYNSSNQYMVAMDGPWALVEKQLEVEEPTDSLTVNFTQWTRRPKYVYVDEFLMRHEDTHVFGLVGEEFFWDGRYYPVQDTSILRQIKETIPVPVEPPFPVE